MKKWILLVLIPMIFLGLFGSSKIGLAAPDSTTVSLDPVFSREVIGNDISVDVVISNVANLYRWEFKIFYETNSLNAISVTEGPFLKSFAGPDGTYFATHWINDAYNSTHGIVWAWAIMYRMPPQPATGSGVLATVKFRGSAGGASHMTLDYPGFAYPVKLSDSYSNSIPCTATTGADVLIAGPETAPLDINVDVGTLYFAREQVEFYVMTTYHGIPVTPTFMNARLYNPDGEFMSLTPQMISPGFYEMTYIMPSDASPGTWAIVVEACYLTDDLEAYGTSFKTCQISSTLSTMQGTITSISNNIATIRTDIGTIKTDISTLNSRLIQIDDTVALIQTNVGLLQTDVSNLQLHVTAIEGSTATIQTTLGTMQGTITSISNNIATIRTDIGTVKVDISNVKANTTPNAVDWTTIGLYVSMALLVSIAIVLVVLYLYMRARFRSGEVPG
jgi:hypothetical protein